MAAAAIFAHRMTPGQAISGNAVSPMDSSSSGSSSNSSDDSAVISANDFLTLLVTEMQNQDPTADTDPDEYVNQLVQVNSLEQLININQTLTTDLGAPSSTSSSDAANGEVSATPLQQGTAASTPATTTHRPSALAAAQQAPGNLSVPATDPAAQRVGHALDGPARHKPSPAMGHFPAAI